MDIHDAKEHASTTENLSNVLKISIKSACIFQSFSNVQEVVRGLYLGPYSAASRSKLDSLLERGITHIVCVRQNIEAHFIKPNFPDQFKYVTFRIVLIFQVIFESNDYTSLNTGIWFWTLPIRPRRTSYSTSEK